MYVYRSYSSHHLKAKLHVGSKITAVAIGEDNTVFVSHGDCDGHWITVFEYDGDSTWHEEQKLKLEGESRYLLTTVVPILKNPSPTIHRVRHKKSSQRMVFWFFGQLVSHSVCHTFLQICKVYVCDVIYLSEA